MAPLDDARLLADRLDFDERRWPRRVFNGWAIWGMANRVILPAASDAEQAGDLTTAQRLRDHVRRQSANARRQQLQQASPGEE